MKNLDILGERIKALRLKFNLTQEELAKNLGYTSRSTINKIEKGLIDIPQSKVNQLSQIFNVSPLYLMAFDKAEDKQNQLIIYLANGEVYKKTLSSESVKSVISYIDNIKKAE